MSGSRVAAIAALAAVALALRLIGMDTLLREGVPQLTDPDTLRRIVRLDHLVDPAAPYPYRDARDGYQLDPALRGSVLHWTLPMDGVILTLDPLARALHPGARRFSAGAAWAGPVLGSLSCVALFLLAAPWLGAGSAFCAALLYSLSYSAISTSAFGNGDHQSLQQLCVVVALGGLLELLGSGGGAALALRVGAALGLGLWVSAETSAVLAVMAAVALASLACCASRAAPTLAARHLQWALAALGVCALADRLEHPGAGLTILWDQISFFQIHPLLVFALFAAATRVLLGRVGRGVAVASALALALLLGLAPLLLPAYREAVLAQLAQARAVELWAQAEVSEFQPLLRVEGFFTLRKAQERFTPLLLLLPFAGLATARDARLRPELRAGLLLAATALFALTLYETKLAHLFAPLAALVWVAGGNALVAAGMTRAGVGSARSLARAQALAGAAAVLVLLAAPHPVTGTAMLAAALRSGSEGPRPDDPRTALLLDVLRELPVDPARPRAVLAHWSLGAQILYQTPHAVVASGYHRNLAGVRDAQRAFTARIPEEIGVLEEILERRGVGWIVTENDPLMLVRGSRAFPELGTFATLRSAQYLGHGVYAMDLAPIPDDTRRTFLWRAHLGGWLSEPVRAGHKQLRFHAEVPRGSLARGVPPAYIIYEVRDAE